MITTFMEAKRYIKRDFEKINGKATFFKVILSLLFEPGFKYIFWRRLTQYFWVKRKSLRFPLFVISRFILKHFSYKFNFDISYQADFAEGFSISHHGYIIIRAAAKIGKDCWVRPGLCIGRKGVVDNSPAAVIGDYVQIGVGVGIFGDVKIGDNVSIGANSVVVKDIPSNCIAAGIPCKVIKRV